MQPTGRALLTLQSARLHFEYLTPENAQLLWYLMRSPYLREFQDIPRLPFENFRQRILSRPPQFVRGAVGRFEWLIRLDPKSAPIGWVSLRTSEGNPLCGELGYSILRAHRRSGYATEAVSAAIEGAFQAGVSDKVAAYCLPENTGSRRVLEQCGLLELRRVRRGAVVRGRPVDILLYELDQIAWRRASRRPRRPE